MPTFELIDQFSYYNVTWVHYLEWTFIPKGTHLLMHALPRYQPTLEVAWNPINMQTRIEPLFNMNPNLTQYPWYSWNGIYWDYLLIVVDAFDRELRYPETWSYKIHNLLPPVTNWAYPGYYEAFIGPSIWGKNIPYYDLAFYQNKYWIANVSTDNPFYKKVPLSEQDYNVSLESSDLRANALTNLTFRFNTCIPLFPWQLNVTAIAGIDAIAWVLGPNSGVLWGENLETNESACFENYTRAGMNVESETNSFSLILNFLNRSFRSDFDYNNNTNYPAPSINFDTINNEVLPQRMYVTFNFTLLNIWNPNYFGLSPDNFRLNYTYSSVLTYWHPIFNELVYSAPALHLNLSLSILEAYMVMGSHDILNEPMTLRISFWAPVLYRTTNCFIYQFPNGTIINQSLINPTFYSGSDVNQQPNWEIVNNQLIIYSPLKSDLKFLQTLEITLKEVIFTDPNTNMDGFQTTILNSSLPSNCTISITNETQVDMQLVSQAGIRTSVSKEGNITMEFTELNMSLCFDHNVPNKGGMEFMISYDPGVFALNGDDLTAYIDDSQVEAELVGNKIMLPYLNNSIQGVFRKFQDCPQICLRNLRNPRSVKPVSTSFQVFYQYASGGVAMAEGEFEVQLILQPKTFTQNMSWLMLSPDTLNTKSLLNFGVGAEFLAAKNDVLTIEIPAWLVVDTGAQLQGCAIINISATCGLITGMGSSPHVYFKSPTAISFNDSINFNLGAFMNPSYYFTNDTLPAIAFNGTSYDGFAMFKAFLYPPIPTLSPMELQKIDYNRSEMRVGALSNVSLKFNTPLPLQANMIINITVNGSFSFVDNLTKNSIILKDQETGQTSNTANFNMTFWQIPFNLSENSIIEVDLLNIMNPKDLNEDHKISVSLTFNQSDPQMTALFYKGVFSNQWICNDSCDKCVNNSDNCLSCKESFYLFKNSCLASCPENYKPDEQNHTCYFSNQTINNASSKANNQSLNVSNVTIQSNATQNISENNKSEDSNKTNITAPTKNESKPETLMGSTGTSFYPGNLFFVNTDFDFQLFLTYYIVTTGLYTIIYAVYVRRKSQEEVRKTKCFMFFWTALEIFCLFFMVVKLSLWREYIFLSFFLLDLIVTYIHHAICLRKVWFVLNKDDSFLLASNEGNKTFISFNVFMFLWNYRVSYLFLSKMGRIGTVIKEQPVLLELNDILKPRIKSQLLFQGFTLIILISFLSLRVENFIRIPFFFIEYVVFMCIFIALSLYESRAEKESNPVPQTSVTSRYSTSTTPTLIPTSLMRILSPMGAAGGKKTNFEGEIKNVV